MPRRILVIDDAPEVCSLVRKVLERVGHEVLTASSGEDGLLLLDASAST